MSNEKLIVKHLPFSKQDLFLLVLDVESYPKFMPWCSKCKIIRKNPETNTMEAELEAKFFTITSSYISVIKYDNALMKIEVSSSNKTFEYLANNWSFTDDKNLTKVDFCIKFKMTNPILNKIAKVNLDFAASTILSSFVSEAEKRFKSNNKPNPA